MGKTQVIREDVIAQALKWALENADNLKASGFAEVSNELAKVKQALAVGELSDTEAARYGEIIINIILSISVTTKDSKVIMLATLLKKLDAPTWAGPVAGKLLQATLRQAPKANKAANEASDWLNEKFNRLRALYDEKTAPSSEYTNPENHTPEQFTADKKRQIS